MQQRSTRIIAGATAGALALSGVALVGIAFTKATPREPGGSRTVRQRLHVSHTWPEDLTAPPRRRDPESAE
jgi:hypothetical protein